MSNDVSVTVQVDYLFRDNNRSFFACWQLPAASIAIQVYHEPNQNTPYWFPLNNSRACLKTRAQR